VKWKIADLRIALAIATLVGRWRSVETSEGSIGAMYEFKADSTMRFSPGAIVVMPYRLEGDSGGPEQKSTIAWTGEDLFRMSVSGQDGGTYRRQGTRIDPRNPLVGEWLGSRQMDGRALEMRLIFDAPAQIDGATALEGTFTISNGELAIHRTGGKVTRLKRY
jgi:hypothetical protein